MTSPQRIGGFPVAYETLQFGEHRVELAMIPDLESHLDRDRLLSDSSYEPPYWALVWSGAQLFLPGFLERHSLVGTHLLDVGCGLGVVSLAAAAAGARVTAVDRAKTALGFLAESTTRNGFEIEAQPIDLASLRPELRFDHVIGAELLYERESFSELASELMSRLAPEGRLTIVDAHRVDTRPFYRALAELGARRVFSDRMEVREERTLVRIDVTEFLGAGA